VDFFRSIPQLVLIVLAYFALPSFGLVFSPFAATVAALALVLSSFAEEIFWASINAVPRGQWEAGRSTGLGFNTTLFNVVLPQAVRMSIPPLTNRAIAISKGTTLGSVVAVPELLNITSSIQSNVANPTALTVGAVLFLVLFLPFVRFTRWLERIYAHPG
jgi:polar amino acid transport system permease protein